VENILIHACGLRLRGQELPLASHLLQRMRFPGEFLYSTWGRVLRNRKVKTFTNRVKWLGFA
jgi:hypothetical protein